jgi:quinol monooxygenase YgiN
MKMRVALSLLLAMVLMPIVSMQTANAQDAAVYVVSYVDVAPAARGTAANLLRQLANASRKDEGNTRFDILQRTAPSNQFGIVAVWKDQKAYDAHLAAAHSKEFRDKIKPYLISAIDDRVHTGMEIAGTPAAKNGRGAIVVVTHVDVPPPKKDECIAALKTLVADSRKETGSVRFDVFQQGNRPNHFSVVEIWKNHGAYDAHITAATTKKFRDQLTPMSGALYDERLYKAI